MLSLLPFTVLYLLSDGLYFILYRCVGYRKEVVLENLRIAFPEKNLEERLAITKKYYHNLCDSIVETVKMFSISEHELNKRVACDHWSVLEEMTTFAKNGQGFVAHQFNWEWATLICNKKSPRQFTGVYLPLTNSIFDRLMYTIRSRNRMTLVKVQEMQQQMAHLQQQEILWGFIADQNPSDPKRVSWNDFFHRKTAFFKAPEFIARRYNNLVYFVEIVKQKRGYYRLNIKLAFEHPNQTSEGDITEAYVRFLEDSIKRQPENWVWSHRRWKHNYSSKMNVH